MFKYKFKYPISIYKRQHKNDDDYDDDNYPFIYSAALN